VQIPTVVEVNVPRGGRYGTSDQKTHGIGFVTSLDKEPQVDTRYISHLICTKNGRFDTWPAVPCGER